MLNMLYMQVIEMLVIEFGKIFPQYLFNHFSATTSYREFPRQLNYYLRALEFIQL